MGNSIAALDMEKVNNGVVVELTEFAYDDEKLGIPWVKLNHQGAANKRYQRRLEVALRPYRRKLELGTIDEKVAEKVFRDIFIELILVDWGKIIIDGTEIKFTPENAEIVLSDPQYQPLYAAMQAEAKLLENFKREQQEIEAGN